MRIVTPMSDISLRLCCLLSVTLELIMVDTGFIKAPHCTEDGVCLSVWARLSCRMAEGVKAQGRSQPACMPGSWKNSMKDGSHCHGQLWQCQFDVLSSRAPHSLLLTAPSRYSCASWWFSDANSHMAKWFSPLLLHPPPSAAGAWVPPTACLSQRAWKLAGEEVLACANYILIIGNVLANQALIAILEPRAPLCRLGMGVGGMWGYNAARPSLAKLDTSLSTTAWYGSKPGLPLGRGCATLFMGNRGRPGCRNGDLCHAYSQIPHSHLPFLSVFLLLLLSFSPTHYTVCQSRHCELRNNK